MHEIACQFGPEERLFGIVSQPERPRIGAPAVLFLTAGLLHHVGPHRLYVQAARQLNTLGFTALRFDLGDVGDSQPALPTYSLVERSVSEIGEAMDYLTSEYGIGEFIVCGLCSGADDALKIAAADKRVTGCVFLDAKGFRSVGFYPRHFLFHYLPRLFSTQKWRHLIERHLHGKDEDDYSDVEFRSQMDQNTMDQQLTELVRRDVKLKFIYTGGASEFINSHKQLPVMFPQASQSANMDMSYLPDSDHLCTLAKDRNKLCRLIAQWADSNFESLVSGDNAAPVQDADDLLKSA